MVRDQGIDADPRKTMTHYCGEAVSVARTSDRLRRDSGAPRIAIGPRPEIPFLLMHQCFQHFAYHLQVVALAGELALQVDEIGRRSVEAVRQQTRHMPRKVGMGIEKDFPILHYINI